MQTHREQEGPGRGRGEQASSEASAARSPAASQPLAAPPARPLQPSTGHERPSITAIITTYNDGEMVGEALRSVAAQTVLPLEILVVDDGSEPATAPDVIKAFTAETGLVVDYVWQENAGPSAARNAGLRLARHELVAFLDADDFWLPEHLSRKVARLSERDASYSTAYDGYTEFEHTSGRTLPTIEVGNHSGPIDADLLGKPGGIPAGMQFQMHRREALLAIGGFDETLRVNEDFDLLLRLSKVGHRITGSGEPTVMRRVHPGSLTRLDPERTLADLERFLQKVERDALLSPDAIASKRKWARLTLGKRQIADANTIGDGIETLRDAFEYDPPRGLQQWAIYGAVKSKPLASMLFAGYRRAAGVCSEVRG